MRKQFRRTLAVVGAIAGIGSAAALPASAAPPAPTLLPHGYLSTSGSQIVGPDGQPVRIAAVGWSVGEISPLPSAQANADLIRAAGFNTITIGWYDTDLHQGDVPGFLRSLDTVVQVAERDGLKVILNHHADEGSAGNGNCLAQQGNGLWFDKGPGTDGTDGCGTTGTVTQAVFRSDWEFLAHRYRHDSTVIGFDLDNEPLAYPGMSTWGDGSVTDIRQMYSTVGSALERIDPGVLIICEGPQNYNGTFAGAPGITSPEGDLTAVEQQPVVLDTRQHQVVYSVHEYPTEISGITDDSGPAAITRYNGDWGFVVKDGFAPVWIGEAGSSMLDQPNDDDWAATLTGYVNGEDGNAGGPTFTGSEQGIGTTWWRWGYRPGQLPDGTLQADGTLKPGQYAVYSAWRQQPIGHNGQ
ncbi:MAG TPA: cellulase family glycosylhydrolase [Mycobacteriales bacterium]|nr:cellulase family glycosylhydrolase [Mycobacteriales bacterium]